MGEAAQRSPSVDAEERNGGRSGAWPEVKRTTPRRRCGPRKRGQAPYVPSSDDQHRSGGDSDHGEHAKAELHDHLDARVVMIAMDGADVDVMKRQRGAHRHRGQ